MKTSYANLDKLNLENEPGPCGVVFPVLILVVLALLCLLVAGTYLSAFRCLVGPRPTIPPVVNQR